MISQLQGIITFYPPIPKRQMSSIGLDKKKRIKITDKRDKNVSSQYLSLSIHRVFIQINYPSLSKHFSDLSQFYPHLSIQTFPG